MADRILVNMGLMSGEYAGLEFQDTESSIATVRLANVIFTKEADKSVWLNNELTMVFTIDNTNGDGPLTKIVIDDAIDATKFAYIDASMLVEMTTGGTTKVLTRGTDYEAVYTAGTPTGELKISFLDSGAAASIPVGSVVTISFRGTKVP